MFRAIQPHSHALKAAVKAPFPDDGDIGQTPGIGE